MTVAVDPHNPWLARTVRIRRIVQELPGVATYDLCFDDAEIARNYSFRPGQFNMLYLPGLGETAISISGHPRRVGVIPHTIREAGSVTTGLAGLPENSCIGLRGPFGSAWPVEQCAGRDVVLVAGGIGLAPLRPAIYELLSQRDRYGKLILLIGAREPSAMLYPAEYNEWRDAGMQVEVTVDRALDGWNSHVGVVTALLDRVPLENPSGTLLMTCGPEVMMWYTIQGAISRGIPADSIYVSLERNMNCAIGLCGHCQLGHEFICRDGPVFRYDRVASILKVDNL